jgi:hypothetical protein
VEGRLGGGVPCKRVPAPSPSLSAASPASSFDSLEWAEDEEGREGSVGFDERGGAKEATAALLWLDRRSGAPRLPKTKPGPGD